MAFWRLTATIAAIYVGGSGIAVLLSRGGYFDAANVVNAVVTTPLWFAIGLAAPARREAAVSALIVGIVSVVFGEIDARAGASVLRDGRTPIPMTQQPINLATFVVSLFLGRAVLMGYLGAVFRRAWNSHPVVRPMSGLDRSVTSG